MPLTGGGADTLRAAGVEVVGGVLKDEALAAQPRPGPSPSSTAGRMVTWKFAATLDGRSAAADGSSAWITGPLARADVHDLRAECDAVLVGTGTVLADDPHLTVRRRRRHRCAGGSRCAWSWGCGRRRPPRGCWTTAAPTLLLPTRDPAEALRRLFGREIRHVWLEGGPTLAAAFLRAGLVDEVVTYLAPALLGSGPAAVGDLGIPSIDRTLRLTVRDVRTLGPDVRIRATTPQGEL